MRLGPRTGWIVLLALVAAALALATMRGVLRAGVGALSADRVLGQIDFIKNAVNFVDRSEWTRRPAWRSTNPPAMC